MQHWRRQIAWLFSLLAHIPLEELGPFNVMESAVWKFTENLRICSGNTVCPTNVLQWPRVCGLCVQGGQSWQFFGKFQRKSPTSSTCFRRLFPPSRLPLPFVHCLFVLRVFALAATTSKQPLDELWARYAVPCLALWHRSQYSRASVITELPFNILN